MHLMLSPHTEGLELADFCDEMRPQRVGHLSMEVSVCVCAGRRGGIWRVVLRRVKKTKPARRH